jgi:hypothetical protein
VTAVKGGVTVQRAGGYKRGGGAHLFPKWLLIFLVPSNITSDTVVNERRRKTFVFLLHMHLDVNEHQTVHVLPVFPTQL